MTPQNQTVLSDKEKGIYGNCLIACYASFMDLPIDECPQFQLLFDVKHVEGFWDSVVKLWLETMGYKRKYFTEDPFENHGVNDYYFAYGISPRGIMHQTIYKDGKLFHDPHPSKAGVEVKGYEVLEKIDDHWRWKKLNKNQ